ncbi:MAG: hypothetical protein ABI287_04470 [Rhodanobacter sp.]
MVAILAAGSVGIAHATPNMVQNGDFSSTSPNQTTPTQFNGNSGACGIDGRSWGGEFVSGWTTNTSGYAVWYPGAAAASSVQACTRYGNTGNQYLPSTVTGAPTGTSSFLGLDGDMGVGYAELSQTINGLTPGDKYTVSFYWASTQEMSRTGDTTERFDVSLGSELFPTATNSIGTHGWSGWSKESFTFTASSTSDILKFLSVGTPGGLPPFALLSDVSMVHNVPEPPVLALFGSGLFGLGLLTMIGRRRALRRRGADGASDVG